MNNTMSAPNVSSAPMSSGPVSTIPNPARQTHSPVKQIGRFEENFEDFGGHMNTVKTPGKFGVSLNVPKVQPSFDLTPIEDRSDFQTNRSHIDQSKDIFDPEPVIKIEKPQGFEWADRHTTELSEHAQHETHAQLDQVREELRHEDPFGSLFSEARLDDSTATSSQAEPAVEEPKMVSDRHSRKRYQMVHDRKKGERADFKRRQEEKKNKPKIWDRVTQREHQVRTDTKISVPSSSTIHEMPHKTHSIIEGEIIEKPKKNHTPSLVSEMETQTQPEIKASVEKTETPKPAQATEAIVEHIMDQMKEVATSEQLTQTELTEKIEKQETQASVIAAAGIDLQQELLKESKKGEDDNSESEPIEIEKAYFVKDKKANAVRFKRAREAFKKLQKRMKNTIDAQVSGAELAQELGTISIHDEANSSSTLGNDTDHSYQAMLHHLNEVDTLHTERDVDLLMKANEETNPAIEMVADPQDKVLGDEPIRAVHGKEVFVSWLKNKRVDVYLFGPKTDRAEFFRIKRKSS